MLQKDQKNQSVLRCLVCEKNYSQGDIFVLQKSDEKAIFHLTCSKCQFKSLNILSINSSGVYGTGVLTDLDRADIREKIELEKISADEVMDVYEIMHASKAFIGEALKSKE